jgi:hypothetical protein
MYWDASTRSADAWVVEIFRAQRAAIGNSRAALSYNKGFRLCLTVMIGANRVVSAF